MSEKCPWCNGTGKIPCPEGGGGPGCSDPYAKCEVCRGKTWVPCKECRGTGKKRD